MSQLVQPFIDEEYYDILGSLQKEERQILKLDIMKRGQLSPGLCNQDGKVIDGKERFAICQELHLPFRYEIKEFNSREEEIEVMISLNLNKKQYTLFRKFEIWYWFFEQETEKAKNRKNQHTQPKTETGRTSDKLASKLGCGHSIVQMMIWLKRNTDERTKDQLRNGTLAPATTYKMLKKIDHSNKRMRDSSLVECPVCKHSFKRGQLKVVKR